MDWAAFTQKYKPITPDGHGDALMFDSSRGSRLRQQYSILRIWTMVDCDGEWWLCPGYHFVNRLGYIVTEQPWDDDTSDVLYD